MRVILASICAFALGVAQAAPQIEIKAQTQLTLDKVRLTGDGRADITGQLLDKLSGEGFANQLVIIKVAGESVTVVTEADGRFHTSIEVPQSADPTLKVELGFRGAAHIDRAELTATTDPTRAVVALSIGVEDSKAGATITVHAKSDDQLVQVPIHLEIGAPTDKVLRPLADLQSGHVFSLTRAAAGGPGAHRLRATFTGDTGRQAATAESTFELTSGTTTTIALSASSVAFEDDLVVTGRVIDEDDRPVSRAAVTLTSGDKRVAQGTTAEDGRYHFKLEAEILGEGARGMQVATDPGAPYMRASRSAIAVVTIAKPQPVPVSYTVAAFVATALAAGGFFLARTKPWRRLRRPSPPAEVAASPIEGEILDGGLVVARPGIVSTLRRPADDAFSGVVRDTVRGRPVGHAIVRLLLGDAERELRTAADGSFLVERLEAGEWQAEVAAPGHVTERFIVSIPHRGELRGVRIDLVPVRERVFQLYRRAAEPVLPESRLWGIWSPRQIVDHVRARRPSPALAELTDFVEEVYFSDRVAAETVLAHASERVDNAIRERARAI